MQRPTHSDPGEIGELRDITPEVPVRRVSASAQVHDALRARIVALDLAPGQPLSRAEVSDTYGVSQTPVREAMQRLSGEGLLRIFPQSKTEVARIDIAHAKETQFLRLSLELEVVRRLATAPERNFIDDIDALIDRQARAFEAGDVEEFTRFDRAFHRRLHCLIGADALWDLVTARSGHIDRLRNLNLPEPGKSASIIELHRRIAAAIRAGEAAEAEAAVREHLSGTLKQVEGIRARYPDFF
ncbi:GntR family transcriptional regulator [Mesobaculum littorinae]|uniref:GntR family transcriptional regulator n=1 Tax=Mesobaculum littorinae TaxID=2486419 RepID=A0A438ALZ8_9RHOB|nr:GntR family transcriptional regulator [Mesobaculum littorinae]RVV99873.1 GntR family transcriptional regulator [Mesobaculum littorinae]